MGDPARKRYALSDGRTVSVPEANASAAEKMWQQKGLSFKPANDNAEPITLPSEGRTFDRPNFTPAQPFGATSESEAPPLDMLKFNEGTGDHTEAINHPFGRDARPVNPAETAVTEFGQGVTFEAGDEMRAGNEAFNNWLRSRMGGEGPVPPVTQGRGMKAPLKGYEDYLAEFSRAREQGKAENPGTATTANVAGSITSGIAAPQLRAARGAGLLAKAATGAGNVAIDTGIGAGTAAMGAVPGERAMAAKEAAPMAAGLSTALRTPGAAVAAGTATRKGALSILPEDVRPAAEALSEMGGAGSQARSAAREGGRALDPTIRKVTGLLNDTEELTDAVIDYGKVGLKRDPVLKGMAKDAVNPGKAAAGAQSVVAEVYGDIDALAQRMGELEPAGKQAVRYAKDAFESAYDNFAKRSAAGAPEEAAADLFMALDQLKRRMGRAVKRAGSGASADPFVEETLSASYHKMRDLLEDESVWGPSAATVQREVNAAWTPWLTTRRAYSKELLASEPMRRSVSPFDDLLDADPKKVGTLFENAGRGTNERSEKVLREGLENTKNITKALAQHYEAPSEIMGKAAQVAKNAHEVSDELASTSDALTRARELNDVSKESPKLGKFINVVGAAEDAARNSGIGKAASAVKQAIPQGVRTAAGKAASIAPEVARKAAAGQTGRATAAKQNETMAERVRATLESDPDALGEYGPLLATARNPDEFAVRHSTLMTTDAGYRRAIRRLSERNQQADEERGQEPQ